jgi:hypothetical protein
VLQCDHHSAVPLVGMVLAAHDRPGYELVLVVEQFVVSTRAARSGTAEAGRITRAMIAELTDVPGNVTVLTQTAGQVKPWATDRKLAAAGLLTPTSKLPHARDAARHALFASVRRGTTRDPMSQAAV